MTLYEHLRSSFPEYRGSFVHKDKDHYEIIECDGFRMIVTPLGEYLRLNFLGAKSPGRGLGPKVVDALIVYCRRYGLIPQIIMPEDGRKAFWRRMGFDATPDDDELWIHEDWSE